MARIHIYVHGRGRGHASRCARISEELRRRGHDVLAVAGADAVPVMTKVVPTEPVDSLPPSLGLATATGLMARLLDALHRNRRARPDVVVSDGDLPGLAAARISGVPAIAIGHGLVFLSCRAPAGAPRLPWLRESIKARLSSLGASRRIAVNFVELPLRRRDAELVRPPVERWPLAARRDAVVCYFRDGVDAARLELLARVAPGAQVFTAKSPTVVPTGVTVRPLDPGAFVASLAGARAVIASAGSQLISECIAHGMPLFVVHARDDDEQRCNAHMLVSAGLGHAAPADALDEAALRQFLLAPAVRGVARMPGREGAAAVADACEALSSAAGRAAPVSGAA